MERDPRKRCQDAQLRDVHIAVDETSCGVKDVRRIPVQPRNETPDIRDTVTVQPIRCLGITPDRVALFVQHVEVVLLDGL